ncbi:MAG TPA: hypothetical protein VFU47_16790 [Armatimonadota bacterium]|nr:hypothetical protein [Armatimonadota bacterium]
MSRQRRRQAKALTRRLHRLETYIREARRDQTAGDPYAEAAINGGLKEWADVRAELARVNGRDGQEST